MTHTPTQRDEVSLAKLPGRAGRVLRALLTTEAGDKLLTEAEQAEVAKRQALHNDLQASLIPNTSDERRHEKACEAAVATVARLEQAVIDARANLNAARAAAAASPSPRKLRAFELTRQLREGADRRLADCAVAVDTLSQRLRQELTFGLEAADFLGRSKPWSNSGEIATARATLDAVVVEISESQLLALTRSQITEMLSVWIARTEQALKPFGLDHLAPPRLTADGEIEPLQRPEPALETRAALDAAFPAPAKGGRA